MYFGMFNLLIQALTASVINSVNNSIEINQDTTSKYLTYIDIKKGPGDQLPGICIQMQNS